MIFLLTGILIVMVLILSILWKMTSKLKLPPKIDDENSFQQYATAMLAKLDEEKRVLQEREMMQYAQSKIKNKPPLPSSTNEKNTLTNVSSQAQELVPFNMTPSERALWKEFNS